MPTVDGCSIGSSGQREDPTWRSAATLAQHEAGSIEKRLRDRGAAPNHIDCERCEPENTEENLSGRGTVMKINCISCGHSLSLDDAYEDFSGLVKCYVCGRLLEIKTSEGKLQSLSWGDIPQRTKQTASPRR